ncbi:LysR family transcriptional regulator [Amylibacter marinus]|uniref:LysR family transcriptional regulator n=1 Tax=Amylibacter marinus TaxID=1475483 RepID=A0ABQ5VXJ3_9RHOB|nr:LysR family transcriptional regulator [Amylibacter marinus]GLQ35786.1 LysR family transcriptional regulator [Amylibacter marinus]
MTQRKKPKDLSLKALELFQMVAARGSLQAVAQESGLTISTVSHHLRKIEDHLGVALFDHQRRPMVLTQKGQDFLHNIEGALLAIRSASAEASAGDIAQASRLRMGSIEDLDSDIMPELAVHLAQNMPRCDLEFHSGSSHDLCAQLRQRRLDLGVLALPSEGVGDLRLRPLLRDPFVVVVGASAGATLTQVIAGQPDLPFLRYSSNLVMARLIEAQLRRIGVSATRRFSCSNNQTLMAMVAANAGWTITTPLLFSRAKRFHPSITMHPFPGKSFARNLGLVSTADCSDAVVDLAETTLRRLIDQHAIGPLHNTQPWLQESFTLVPQ